MVPVPMTSGQMLSSQHVAHGECEGCPHAYENKLRKDDWESIIWKCKNAKSGGVVWLVSL